MSVRRMRATNLVMGTTTLAAIAAALTGLLVFQKVRTARSQSPLRVVIDGSASGLRKGGSVNFDGVQAGHIVSIKLESPRKVVALVMLDNNAPIRKDTAVGIEFQGLTGIAAISLIGGAAAAPPVPLDEDGVPILTADLSEQESIVDSLHNVDRVIVNNKPMIKDALLSFESYTASLKSKGDAIDGILGKADAAFAGFDGAVEKIEGVIPGFTDGQAEELFEKMKSLREMANTFRQRSATVMEESRRSLQDLSEAANRMGIDRRLVPQPAAAPGPAGPRRPLPKR
jgi:phospholipid/cholesterol/gamma-HCH transport system substrate-binding protein